MSDVFRTLCDVEVYLEKRGLFHIDLGLDRVLCALKALDLNHPRVPVVQVLGTNGKGSTVTFLAALCEAHGLTTGVYTSPHFLSFRERIRLRGASDADWLRAANAVAEVADDLTYFEFLTVLALFLFTHARVDVILLEAGLGGAHDATTAVTRTHQIFTPIALDHRDILGEDVQAIAGDKAGAIFCGARLVSAAQFPLVREVLERQASLCGVRLEYAEPLPQAFRAHLGMAGDHQIDNAGLALGMWRHLARACSVTSSDRCIETALASARIPGRLQRVPKGPDNPPLLLDGAHNPHGMQTMLRSLPEEPSVLVFACLADKDWRTLIRLLRQRLHDIPVCFPQIANPRALPPDVAARAWFHEKKVAPYLSLGLTVPDTIHGLTKNGGTKDGLVLVTGSLYLLAEVFALFPSQLTEKGCPSV